jgi:hypothetical protein
MKHGGEYGLILCSLPAVCEKYVKRHTEISLNQWKLFCTMHDYNCWK